MNFVTQIQLMDLTMNAPILLIHNNAESPSQQGAIPLQICNVTHGHIYVNMDPTIV